ncbi:hypothetical protein C8J57DRAFT_121472 [Mycena rebaudengoi]|nr:hypothetical protein C8J57DRAFT_121472 [Mycena rebaudengoi]
MANPNPGPGPPIGRTVTGTLLGVVYPTAIAQFSNGVYNFPGPVPWIPNSPQISILGVGINNNLPQTTYSYKDLYTLNLGGGFLKTVTQNGILVQDAAGLFFTEPATAAVIPVVETCAFAANNQAICQFADGDGPLDFTATAFLFPFFTYTLELPATSSGGPSSTSHSSSESRTSRGLTTNTQGGDSPPQGTCRPNRRWRARRVCNCHRHPRVPPLAPETQVASAGEGRVRPGPI